MTKYYLDASTHYNHGCTDTATYEDRGDGTALCIETTSCSSCWQVGHTQDYEYDYVGHIRPVAEILADWDYVDDEAQHA